MIKRFDELNYYELLRVPYGASSFEIRQAYKHALVIYEESSLATYSLFTEDERKTILANVEKAFLTLLDAEKRTAYDKNLASIGEVPEDLLTKKEQKKAIPLFQINKTKNRGNNLSSIRKKINEKGAGNLRGAMLERDFISGEDLKNLRESLGIELEEMFQATKISPTTLEAIEKDRIDNLPPKVYLKSFLKSYAEALQLDARQIVEKYLRNIDHN
jgi:DnaJ-class molecular chaperone